ncbi:hypothetical protein J1N35_043930 [Gossypium stocksii]|uniref:PAR1 protein n=1 Tax=Gossypium stocksii TaxID=47602 RepID=A0A9D3U8K1_9ROSI|nr:hypothetical protein J1N35_043930 [Gossypium stocksii]
MPCFKLPLFLFLSSFFLHASLAEIICDELPNDVCAFAIASSGKRCLLETGLEKNEKEYQCRTSEVMVERMAEYIENDDCVRACGVDRNSIGISSDSLLEAQFTAKLCASACCHNCPNIVDLFFNLAAGEGVFLPDLCEAQRINPRRSMVELMSSSGAALGPISSEASALAPSPTPHISSEVPDSNEALDSILSPSSISSEASTPSPGLAPIFSEASSSTSFLGPTPLLG